MKSLFFILAVLSFNAAFAQTESQAYKNKAYLYVCNQTVYNYCSQTKVWGQGFGQIVFERGGEKRYYDVRPWGGNPTDAAILTGKVQALIAIESRKHPKERFFRTPKFLATGYLGLDPILKKKTIFYLLRMEDTVK